MRTPHRITLIRGLNIMGRYNPATDSYEKGVVSRSVVPCFVTVKSQQAVFEEYGKRDMVVIICRFMQVQEPFARAEFDGKTFEPIEVLNAPIKGAVRLKEVQNSVKY